MKYALRLIMVICLTGCINISENKEDLSKINLIRETHVKAVNTSDVDLILKDMSSDVVYLAPDIEPIEGKEALRELITPYHETAKSNIKMIPQDIRINNKIAIEWGLLHGEVIQIGSDSIQKFNLKYIVVYEKDDDGSWTITREIYNKVARH